VEDQTESGEWRRKDMAESAWPRPAEPKGPLEVGKLPMDLLQRLLTRYSQKDERVVVGPRIGEDAAVIDMGERYLVAKSDPITFATDEIGWYVVHVNTNDVAAMGARPRWFLLTLLLPDQQTEPRLVEGIFRQVAETCQELGIVLCGGHTEITHGLERPIAIGVLLGEVEKGDLVRTSGALVGDDVILTKGIAIEGTAILAREAKDRLAGLVDGDTLERGCGFLHDPGISVLRDARIAVKAGRVHAMHDPTEGGLATGLWELAHAADKGVVVDLGRVHLFEETASFCRALDLDPMGLIASGALLLAVEPGDSAQIVAALREECIEAAVIGEVVDGPVVVQAKGKEGLRQVPVFEQDELTRVL
jgi:hydrogenase expression/formation protein HypE